MISLGLSKPMQNNIFQRKKLIVALVFVLLAASLIYFYQGSDLNNQTEASQSEEMTEEAHTPAHAIAPTTKNEIVTDESVTEVEDTSPPNHLANQPFKRNEQNNPTPVPIAGKPEDAAKAGLLGEIPNQQPPVSVDIRINRRFGKGAPFQIADLPEGKLKTDLFKLNAEHQKNALNWLHSFTFSGIDAVESLRTDSSGGIFYDCYSNGCKECAAGAHKHPKAASTEDLPPYEETTTEVVDPSTLPQTASASVPISSPPVYNSKPGSTNHIYLDFNGGIVPNTTAWGNTTWNCYSYSLDTDYDNFSDAEQTAIRRIYERVAEDYAPFDVNVTTDKTYDPDTYSGNKNKVAWVLITRAQDKNSVNTPAQSGGRAYLGVFGQSNFASTYQPAWVTYSNLSGGAEDSVAEATSHEVGHNMGLTHDTRSNEGYYGGHGTGNISWGPIMGTGYGRNVTQWSKGEYYDAKHAEWNGATYDNNANTDDDLAIINGKVSYRTDDHGDTNGNATVLTLAGNGTINDDGIIERTSETDVFAFQTGAGTVTLNATPYLAEANTKGGNLDILMELYNSGGSLVTSNNGATATNASISTTLSAGTYYVHIKPCAAGNASGTGSPYDSVNSTRAGYTVYGSLGQYTLSGNVVLPGVSINETGTTNVTEGGATDTYSISLGTAPNSNVTVNITPNSQITTNKSSVVFTPGNWNIAQTVTVTAVDDNLEEGPHTGTITHTSSSSDSAFNGIGVGSVTVVVADNDNVVIISPNGGENLLTNTTNTVLWDSLLGGNVKIELLKNGSLNSTIISSTPNDGSYNWSTPRSLIPGSDYKIRITSIESPTKSDTSATNFSIAEGPIYFTDLEANPGFTTTGDWTWGTPSGTNAASAARSGTKMYDTNLSATSYTQGALTTIAIDCSAYGNVNLEFYAHIKHYDPDFSALFEVSNDGTTWTTLYNVTGLNSGTWVKHTYNISAVADGKSTVYVRWNQIRNGASVTQWGGGGIAIDDVKLTGNFLYANGINVSSPNGGESLLPNTQNTITWASGMGGNVKIELLKGGSLCRLISASTPNDESFTWTFSTGLIVGNDYKIKITTLTDPTKFDVSTSNFTILAEPIYYVSMDSNPGWTLGTGWAYGQPTGGQQDVHGNPDPTSGYNGTNVIGYNLSGDYEGSIGSTRWVTTPAINCSGRTNVTLSFRRWLGVEAVYDHAYIEVSNNGSIWTRIWENTTTTDDNSWVAVQYDISAVANNKATVYIRWGLGTTDSSWNFSGWNIDEVIVNGTPTLTPYQTWSGGLDFNVDSNGDDINNGIAWVIGASNFSTNAKALLPVMDNASDANYFIYTYRRSDTAKTDPNTIITVEYSSNLSGWTTAVDIDPGGSPTRDIIITETNDSYGTGVDKVEVRIKKSLAVGQKLFTRLKVVIAP